MGLNCSKRNKSTKGVIMFEMAQAMKDIGMAIVLSAAVVVYGATEAQPKGSGMGGGAETRTYLHPG
jgi:hypothetical protein